MRLRRLIPLAIGSDSASTSLVLPYESLTQSYRNPTITKAQAKCIGSTFGILLLRSVRLSQLRATIGLVFKLRGDLEKFALQKLLTDPDVKSNFQKRGLSLGDAKFTLKSCKLCVQLAKKKILEENGGLAEKVEGKRRNRGGPVFFEEPEDLLMDQLKRSSKACAGMLLTERKHGIKRDGKLMVDIKVLAFEVVFSYMIRGVQVSASESRRTSHVIRLL